MLHFRLFILKDEKTERCFPKNAAGKEIFLFSYNEKH